MEFLYNVFYFGVRVAVGSTVAFGSLAVIIGLLWCICGSASSSPTVRLSDRTSINEATRESMNTSLKPGPKDKRVRKSKRAFVINFGGPGGMDNSNLYIDGNPFSLHSYFDSLTILIISSFRHPSLSSPPTHHVPRFFKSRHLNNELSRHIASHSTTSSPRPYLPRSACPSQQETQHRQVFSFFWCSCTRVISRRCR